MAGERIDEFDLLEALHASLSDEFDVLGFLGRKDDTTMVYLSREHSSGSLVVLMVTGEGTDPDTGRTAFSYSEKRKLDASVPDQEARCPRCLAPLRQWARFCTQCGTDVSGISATTGGHHSRTELLESVRAQAGDEYEVLGDMERAEGGGLVYFAKERATERVVALRLNREGNQEYSLNVTRVLKVAPQRGPGRPRAEAISLTRRRDEMLRAWKEEQARLGGTAGEGSRALSDESPRRVADTPPPRFEAPPRYDTSPATDADTTSPVDKRLVVVAIIAGVLLLALVGALIG